MENQVVELLLEEEEDDDLLLYYYYKYKTKRRLPIKELYLTRGQEGSFSLLMKKHLMFDDKIFGKYFRLNKTQFDYVLNLLKKKMREKGRISLKEKLALTLRFMANGETYASLSFAFRISPSYISQIVKEVLKHLKIVLVSILMPIPKEIGESRQVIAYLSSNDAVHILTQWAIWMTGNIALPLTSIHPPDMLKYYINDSHAALVICSPEHEKTLGPVAKETKRNLLVTSREKHASTESYPDEANFKQEIPGKNNKWYGENDAMIIYTSGTTSNPKGVVWTHSMLATQIASLHAAWQYNANDVVLHTLPLHHVHGQLNSVNATLASGARLRMLPSFTTHAVWSRLIGMDPKDDAKVTVFHGVPAMYARLAADHERMFPDPKTAHYVKQTLSKMRLMCAGSSALPETLFLKWEKISGQRLLERYGMTEVGMALSNPYTPVDERTVGCVGVPLPGVTARIAAVNEKTGKLEPLVTVETADPDCEISLDRLGLTNKDYFAETDAWAEPQVTEHTEPRDGVHQGELLLKGPSVFSRYLNRPPKTDDSEFVDGYFRTGDTASYGAGRFKILGRTSIDIIKTAGFKVSALQVEAAILEHPNVSDAAVLGFEHETLGELIAAVVALSDPATTLTMRELKGTLSKKLAPYQLPRTLLLIDEMPRNAMGKLDKKKIKELYGKELGMKRQKA